MCFIELTDLENPAIDTKLSVLGYVVLQIDVPNASLTSWLDVIGS